MRIHLTDDIKEDLKGGPDAQAGKIKLHGLASKVTRLEKQEGDGLDIDRAMITTESSDREDDIVVAEGGHLENFKRNPVVLFGHNYWQPSTVMGRSILEVVRPGVGIEAAWTWADKENEEAATVKNLWRGYFLNAISIGFIPLEWEKREYKEEDEPIWPGYLFTEWELLEYSIVVVPMNQDALRLAAGLIGAKIEGDDQGVPGQMITGNQGNQTELSAESHLHFQDLPPAEGKAERICETTPPSDTESTEPTPKDDYIELLANPEIRKILAGLQPLVAELSKKFVKEGTDE
jgi:hypothetical protein